MWNRVLAVLVAIVVMATIQHGLSLQWYSASVFGILAYLIVRYDEYAIGERRRMKADVEEAMRAVARGRQTATRS